MEMLDLWEHDPEDFEGKGITIGGVPYELGPEIGSGVDKIIHVLRNHTSGLHLSVLAIYRDAQSAPPALIREKAARILDGMLNFNLVPDVMEVSLPGGIAHMQDYAGPYEMPQHPDVAKGDDLFGRHRWKAALRAYSRALRDRPHHTVAMHNQALALARLGRIGEASDAMSRAVQIEPNHLPYLRSWVEYSAAAHRPTAVWDGCRMAKEKYSYDDSFDALLDAVPHMARLLSNEADELVNARKWDQALERAKEAANTFERLVALDGEKYEKEQAVSLANFGRCAVRSGALKTAVGPLFNAMAIAKRCDNTPLFHASLAEFRQAVTRDPEGVAAEFQRLYGTPLPAQLRPADNR